MHITKRPILGRLTTLLACMIAATTAQAASPEALRDAYVTWRGGDAFKALHSRHYSGDLQVSTLKGSFESWEDCAGRYRLDVHAGAIEVSTRVDGSKGFSLTPGGQVETLSAQNCESQLLSMLTSYAGVLEGTRGAKLSALPDKTDGAATLEGFRIQFPNRDLCDYYLRKNGELVSCRAVVDGAESNTTFSDWRSVDAVRLPYSIDSINSADGQRTLMHVLKDSLNPTIEEETFGEPKTKSRLSFQAGAHDSGTIAFELLKGSRLFLPGTVAGKEAILMLDSGAEVSVLDVAFAKAAGIEPTGHMDVRGTGGTENLAIASNVSIALGKLTLRTGMVVLMDLGQISKMIDHPVHAVLGKEVLNETITDIDFEVRTIDFRDPSTYTPGAEMTRVPLTVASGIRTVPVRIEGHEAVNADFDLGNGGPLMIFPTSMAKWGLLKDRPVAHRLGGGVGGMRSTNVVTIKSMEIGGYTLRDLPADAPVSTEGLAFATSETIQGNVGMPVWSRFHLVMDFGRNQLFLHAKAESLARPFLKNRGGMTVVREGDALKVLFVDPAFPAPVCKEGADIVAIDGAPVSDLPSKTSWSEQPAGTIVKLTFRDGTQADLKLADYY